MEKNRTVLAYFLTLVLGVWFGFIGCAKQTPVAPDSDGTAPQFLKHLSRPGLSIEAYFQAEQFVTVKEGWQARIGDDIAGYSSLDIPPKALYSDTQIQFSFSSAGEIGSTLSDASFGPHGTEFKRPVTIGISYKDADLTGVDERHLNIYYLDDEKGIWKKIPSRVDRRDKVVYASIHHFSRYAVALSR